MIKKFKRKRRIMVYNTIVVMALICAIFGTLILFFHHDAEKKAYDQLCAEATYIKKDLSIRIKADRKSLANLASFAASLYEDGRPYDVMFDSFEPIGLVSSIGILTPDNIFLSKKGSFDLNGKLSFKDEIKKGEYISGRIQDLTIGEKEIIRCATPVISNGKPVGILYGGISLDTIESKYASYVKNLNAHLFIYDKATGKFIVDTVNETPSELSMLMDREYDGDYSYEDFLALEHGFSSFESATRDENNYVYFSSFKNLNWGLILGKYQSDLFKEAHVMTRTMLLSLFIMLLIIVGYFLIFIKKEKRKNTATHIASEIKKLLLEISQKPKNITESLQVIAKASGARTALFMDECGDTHDQVEKISYNNMLTEGYKKRFKVELFRYAAELEEKNHNNMCVIDLAVDENLLKQNKKLYDFFKKYGVENIVFSAITYNGNNGILGVVNPEKKYLAHYLIDEIAICFSIAIYNKKHLNRTQIEATTDALTGVLNRTAYKNDLETQVQQDMTNIVCIYIDVNELHIRNNAYGHAAGDKMLIHIADLLKNTFADEKIYRIGGDEFLVFVRDAKQEELKKNIEAFFTELDKTDYHVAMGVSYGRNNSDMKKLVKEAERRMYDSKANYYQNKMQTSVYRDDDIEYIQNSVEKQEVDTILSAMHEHFSGVLRVSLKNDTSQVVLAKAYPGRNKSEKNFSKRFSKYVDEAVQPDFHRKVMSFLNYDVLKRQLEEGNIPNISYKKINGEIITLSVYSSDKNTNDVKNTLWFFGKG